MVGGLKVFEANPVVEAALADRGRLWFRSDLEHSYPHCWRCHQPVIFLATSQWFISMEGLREAAIAEANGVRWIPDWGRERMTGMLVSRPDWCISRQRAWGVPIPALTCDGCGESHLTPGRSSTTPPACSNSTPPTPGTRMETAAFVPAGFACEKCGGTAFDPRAGHPRRLVRLGIEPRGRARAAPAPHLAGRSVPRGHRPASRLVSVVAAHRRRHARSRAVPRRAHARLRRRRTGTQDVQVARQHDRAAAGDERQRRRSAAALGVDGRLSRRGPARQGSAVANGRGVPEDPQHVQVPALESLRLRSGRGHGRSGPDARSRSVRARALRQARRRGATRLRGLRLPERSSMR